VANVTPGDIEEFLQICDQMDFRPVTETYSLEEANIALMGIKKGNTQGTKVLVM
jgi:propanol-preferring alcohol dehydrogenase